MRFGHGRRVKNSEKRLSHYREAARLTFKPNSRILLLKPISRNEKTIDNYYDAGISI